MVVQFAAEPFTDCCGHSMTNKTLLAKDLADNIVWPRLGLFVDPANILSNNAQEEQVHTGKERNSQNYCRETLRRM